MAPPNERHGNLRSGFNPLSSFIQSTTSTFSSLLSPRPPRLPSETTPFASVVSTSTSSGIDSTPRVLLPLPLDNSRVTVLTRDESSTMKPPDSVTAGGNSLDYDAGFSPSTFKIGRMSSAGKGGGGPAFVGQVFSMCDLTGTGLMAVSTHFDIPFLSKRTPEWMKKMLQRVVKSDSDPVFRFFMDLGDAVAYVKQLNIPSGIVGACRLDLAYEHFKGKPHLFQFIPNEKQVKLANKLLKKTSGTHGTRKIDGVPVFSAQNLDIAIATTDGIKWYKTYFFDKSTLDNIIEESIDQHFHALIQNRHLHRRRDVIDDNLPAEVSEETAESMFEPAEVQEVLDEVGYPAIPFSVISKAAEMQLMYAVDRLLLGNKWLRKATGIQPKVPYMIDSFEKRSAASLLSASEASKPITQIFVEFLTKVTNFEQLVDVGGQLLSGFQEGLRLFQRKPVNKSSELVTSIIKQNENYRLKSYMEAGWVKADYKVKHMCKMNTSFEGLQDFLIKAARIVCELEQLMDSAGCVVKMLPKNSYDVSEKEEDEDASSVTVDATEYASFMTVIYSMLKQDYMMQEKIVSSLNLATSAEELDSYCLMWSLRPFVDDDVINQALRYIP